MSAQHQKAPASDAPSTSAAPAPSSISAASFPVRDRFFWSASTFESLAKEQTPLAPSQLEVRIYHPNPDSKLPFFIFLANDQDRLHFGFVHQACCVVSGNLDGTLVHYERGRGVIGSTVDLQWDDLLMPGDYSWLVGGTEQDWPIVRSFREWKLPGDIDERWKAAFKPKKKDNGPFSGAKASDRVKVRDGHCLLTRGTDALSAAHVVPQAEYAWFLMQDALPGEIDYLPNHITLAKDKHRTYDNKGWTAFPKGGKITCHFLLDKTALASSSGSSTTASSTG